jgi:hypothetical protein
MSRPRRYTAGIKKIAIPPRLMSTPNSRDHFLEWCTKIGYELAAWNGEIYLRDGGSWIETCLLITDFEY